MASATDLFKLATHRNNDKAKLAWSRVSQLALDDLDQISELRGRPCPEDKAVAWIYVVRILPQAIELYEVFVQDPPLEVGVENLGFLLRIACCPVELVPLLDVFLLAIRPKKTL